MKHTDLGSQYPKERFRQRIGTLVNRASISLVARNETGSIVGVCFGITDFAYWLFITDLGVARECAGQGIGTALVKKLHQVAGDEVWLSPHYSHNWVADDVIVITIQ